MGTLTNVLDHVRFFLATVLWKMRARIEIFFSIHTKAKGKVNSCGLRKMRIREYEGYTDYISILRRNVKRWNELDGYE